MYMIEATAKKDMGEGSIFRQQATMFKIPLDVIEQADRCEVWGTSFDEVGPDYCEYRFFKDHNSLTVIHVKGY